MTLEDKVAMWRRYFDRIYCVHYLPAKNKLPRLLKELERVGIMDSGLLEWRYTVPCPYDELLFQRYKSAQCDKVAYVNLALGESKMLYEALHFGYERILVLEDDVAFLKDMEEARRIIEAAPWDYDILQFDKFAGNLEVYKAYLRERVMNERWFDGKGWNFTSAACFSLSRLGMAEMLNVQNERTLSPDWCWMYMTRSKYAVAVENLAVQIVYGDCGNLQYQSVDLLHRCYRDAGVDYANYSVPDGYGMGKVYEEKGAVAE